jgi:hypothetical protein
LVSDAKSQRVASRTAARCELTPSTPVGRSDRGCVQR